MTQTVSRTARQARILEILVSTRVSSQIQLSELLQDEGIEITQATLSRDLDELGAKKVRPNDGGVHITQCTPTSKHSMRCIQALVRSYGE